MLESTGSTVDEWRERSAPCRFRFLPRSGPSTPSVQPSRPAPAPVAALRRIRQSPRTSRSDRSLRAMPGSRFGLSLRPACGLRCRSPSHTSERYVPVRLAGACSGQETNDTDRLSGVSEVLAETRLRVQALSAARAAPSPHHPERVHESLRSGPLPGSGRCIRASARRHCAPLPAPACLLMASTADAKGVGGVFSKNTQAWPTAARVVMLGAPLAVGDGSRDGAYESRTY